MSSKLDNLSKEDLIRLAKKSLGINKDTKEELGKLRKQLEESEQKEKDLIANASQLQVEISRLSKRNEELVTKQAFLIESSKEVSDTPTAAELVLRSRIADLEKEVELLPDLTNENKSLSETISRMIVEADTLRSNLEDKIAELAALKDQKATTDIFSFEIEDYDKKVRVLEKDLAVSKSSNASLEADIVVLKAQLEESTKSNATLDDERHKFQQEAQKLTTELCESQVTISQLKTEVSSLQEQLNGLMENQGSEKLGLGRELAASIQRIATLEELSEALREENIRLRNDNASFTTQIKDLEEEYEQFKIRSRYVLEQKKKTTSDNLGDKSKIDDLEANITDLTSKNDILRKEVSVKHDELERFKERTTAALANLDAKRREADELHSSLSSTMDELRFYRIKFENVVAQLTETSQRLGESDSEKALLRQEILKSEALLKFEKNRFEETIEQLNMQISEESQKREEISKMFDESQQKVVKIPLIAAVQPQIYDYEEPRRDSPDSLTQPIVDRSLVEVIFGEESNNDYAKQPTAENIAELLDEVFRLRKQAEHTTSLLNESEAANGRLIEQSHCLKEEIRRLERNEERKSHFENTEYLKNVIIKFLTPEKVATEKCQLIPILNTMLRLSEEELQILQRATQQDGSAVVTPGSWGSYFKWGGMS